MPSPSDERGIAVVRVLRIDADKNPEDHKIARLRALLIGLETGVRERKLRCTLGRLHEACLGSSTH
ncbi:hypothetical protein ACWFR5_18025 [Streptomyces sp. NPDC055092]